MAHIAVAITIYIVHDEGQWTSPVEVKIVPPQPYVSEAPMYAGVIVVADNSYDNDNNSYNTNSTNDISNTNNDTDGVVIVADNSHNNNNNNNCYNTNDTDNTTDINNTSNDTDNIDYT